MAGLTYTDILTKLKTQAKATEATVVTQLVQDYNLGYQAFLAKLTRYWTRKQQFANLEADQQIYQLPVDCNKIIAVTVQVSTTYDPPLMPVRDENVWRSLTSTPITSAWPSHYFIIGDRQIALWPTPSADIDLALRVVYQPRAFNLSVADVTSTTLAATATVTNGSQTVTLSGAVLTTDQTALAFQATGLLDDTFYNISSSTTTTLTLEAPYVGSTASGVAFRIGQLPNLPPEYHSVPLHYALWLYFSANGDSPRALTNKTLFDSLTSEALGLYSSSQQSGVITEDEVDFNPWLVPPPPGA